MKTSGRGGRDNLMTTVPLAMLVIFVMFMGGGPRASLGWLESMLRGGLDWAISLLR